MPGPRVFVGPHPDEQVSAAVTEAGGRCVPAPDAEAAVWLGGPAELREALQPGWRWVQLPSAGVEHYLEQDVLDGDRTWTSAAAAFGRLVAEHALALVLAGRRRLADLARARSWHQLETHGLDGTRIAIVGAGEIGRALIGFLTAWDVEITAVTRSGRGVQGAARSLPADRLDEVWPAADVVVLAAPATSGTRHLVGADALRALPDGALVVNVARGSLVDTDALVEALRSGRLLGAALDVTDPEPLPEDHGLWACPGALVTPHVANPPGAIASALAVLVGENVRRFGAGDALLGRIDVDRGY